MTYQAVPDQDTGDSWTATESNTYYRGNMLESGAEKVTTKGDIVVGAGADSAQRLGVGSNDQMLETLASESGKRKWVNSGLVPVGGIVIWSGLAGSIPSGWQLCNGTNGTPDLRDKFVAGAGSSYSLGWNSGAATIDLQHSHTLTSPTSSDGHTHSQDPTDSDGAHSHNISGSTAIPSGDSVSGATNGQAVASLYHTHTVSGATASSGAHSHTNPSTDSDGAHSHTISDTGSTNALSTAVDNKPPYYGLCFIQRMS